METGQLERAVAALLAILPAAGLLGLVVREMSKERAGGLLFWFSTAIMTVLALCGGPFR